MIVVPVGVGSLGAAAARYGAAVGAAVIGVEPETAACLTAALAGGRAGRDPDARDDDGRPRLREVSEAAWPSLLPGIRGTITVSDVETHAAMRELADAGLAIGESGAAPLAALPALADLDVDPGRVLLIATEGPTDPFGIAPRLMTPADGPAPSPRATRCCSRSRWRSTRPCCSSSRRCRRSRSCS